MIEKIDVIEEVIYVYNENMELIKSIPLNTLEGLDLSYLNDCKLFTLNISQPIKRVIKFSELQGVGINAVFVETLYENMTTQQATDFDDFLTLINSIL